MARPVFPLQPGRPAWAGGNLFFRALAGTHPMGASSHRFPALHKHVRRETTPSDQTPLPRDLSTALHMDLRHGQRGAVGQALPPQAETENGAPVVGISPRRPARMWDNGARGHVLSASPHSVMGAAIMAEPNAACGGLREMCMSLTESG